MRCMYYLATRHCQ